MNFIRTTPTPPEQWFPRQGKSVRAAGRFQISFVLTTYRLTEHHTAGGMSRFLSHLAELQPEMFAEISTGACTELKIETAIIFA